MNGIAPSPYHPRGCRFESDCPAAAPVTSCTVQARTASPHIRPLRQNPHTVTSDCNRVMVYQVMILFTTMTGPQPSARATADPRTVRLALELLERTAGRRRRCRRCRSVIGRERAQARSSLVGLHTVRPGDRGRDPPARDRTGTPPAMPGVPDRHRPPASRRPNLRRRLQKRALADLAPSSPPGTLIRGGARWPNPPRTSTIRPAGPPTRTCSTAPGHRVAEIVDGTLYTHPRPAPPHAVASSRLGFDLGGPFDRGRGGPGGWWIIDEPELHLGEDILVPDLAGWRRDRMVELPDTAYFTLGA